MKKMKWYQLIGIAILKAIVYFGISVPLLLLGEAIFRHFGVSIFDGWKGFFLEFPILLFALHIADWATTPDKEAR